MNEPTQGEAAAGDQGESRIALDVSRHVADVGSIHRLRWGDVDGDRRLDLSSPRSSGRRQGRRPSIRSPAHGRGLPIGAEPEERAAGSPRPSANAPSCTRSRCSTSTATAAPTSSTADNLGVALINRGRDRRQPGRRARSWSPGAPGDGPKKGASEVHLGRLSDGRRFLATIEPWHGTEVAVYLARTSARSPFGPRTVIDTTLNDGHALWVADVDGDGDDEVFAGYRGPGTSVLVFDFDGKTWDRTVLDPAIAAQDLRGGDLDGDGTPDVVAIGGKTHNVVWYRYKVPGR